MIDIIIVGAGPSGLTAGIYARRNDKSVIIFEKKAYGGQIVNAFNVENYPGFSSIFGFELATKLYNQAKDLGAKVIYEEVLNIKRVNDKIEVTTNKNKYLCKKVIIASGCENRKLNLENEDKLIGKGISYCATCDGAFYKNKTVAVFGGGNTAIGDALYLTDYVKKVYVIYKGDKFKAEIGSVNRLKNKKNVEILYNTEIKELITDNDKLKQIRITNNKTKKEQTIESDGLFVAIGHIPASKNFENVLNLDKSGYAISDECTTKDKSIFVAGDVRQKEVRQLTTATSDGTIAALKAIK